MSDESLIKHVGLYFPKYIIMRDKHSPHLCWNTYDPKTAKTIADALNLVATEFELPTPLAYVGSPVHEYNKTHSEGSAPDAKDSWVFLDDSKLFSRGQDILNQVLSITQGLCINVGQRSSTRPSSAREIITGSRVLSEILGDSYKDKSGGRNK